MSQDKKQRPFYQRLVIDIAGFGLMIISPFLGWLPGPGGIPLFLAGLGLVSLNHEWAENLLKDFDRYRVEFTDKYLMASPRVSVTIDFVCIALLCLGAYVVLTQNTVTVRAPGLGIISLSLIVLVSNQKRWERFKRWLTKHKHKHK